MGVLQKIIDTGQDDADRLTKPELFIYLAWVRNNYVVSEGMEAAAQELARLRAVEEAARDMLPTIAWWSDGYDDGAVYRCVGCDVERDDVQSGADTHHDNCRVGKLIAALESAK